MLDWARGSDIEGRAERSEELAEEGKPHPVPAAESAVGASAAWRQTFMSLGNPTFRVFWLGTLANFAAVQMSTVTRGFLAFELGGTATAVGLIALVRGLPTVFLALVGGAIADRVDRRKLYMTTQSLMALVQLANAILNITGHIQLWHLALLMLAEGTLFSFNMPTRQALIPQLVSREELPNAIALNSVGANLSSVVGPSVAGVLIALPWVGVGGTFLVATVLLAANALLLLKLPVEAVATTERRRPVLSETKEGLLYVARSPILKALMIMAFVPLLLGTPYLLMLPVFQKEVFHVGSSQLGLMYAMTGIGAVMGSLTVASLATGRRRSLFQLMFGLSFGVGLLLFAAAGRFTFTLALPALMLVGFSNFAYQALNNALILMNADPSHHGRVSSLLVIVWAVTPMFALPLGVLADAISAPVAVGGAGVLVVLFLLAYTSLTPAYRRLAATM